MEVEELADRQSGKWPATGLARSVGRVDARSVGRSVGRLGAGAKGGRGGRKEGGNATHATVNFGAKTKHMLGLTLRALPVSRVGCRMVSSSVVGCGASVLASDAPLAGTNLTPSILVVGVGGGGCNAVNNMISRALTGVDFLACNTDAQSLAQSLAHRTLHLGRTGLGAGASPRAGYDAAAFSYDAIMDELKGNNMVFLTAGTWGYAVRDYGDYSPPPSIPHPPSLPKNTQPRNPLHPQQWHEDPLDCTRNLAVPQGSG